MVGRVRKFASEKHFASVLQVFPDAFVSGKFCDVKIVCEVGDLVAHSDTVQHGISGKITLRQIIEEIWQYNFFSVHFQSQA